MRIEAEGLKVQNNHLIFEEKTSDQVREIAEKILNQTPHPEDCRLSFTVDNDTIRFQIDSESSEPIEGSLTVSDQLASPLILASLLNRAARLEIPAIELAKLQQELAELIIKNLRPPSQETVDRIEHEAQKHEERHRRERKREAVLEEIKRRLTKEVEIKEENVYDASVKHRIRDNG